MGTIITAAIVTVAVLVALVFLGVVATKLYHRASKETAFVRTGARGAKVVMDGGAMVIPVLHETIPVSLKTHKLNVKKTETEALITFDKLRADVIADFYVRVARDDESIQAAAATLGAKASDPAELNKLVDSKFVDGLRSVASSMTMMDLHLKRAEFVQAVQETVAEDLKKNGLELESVSLTALDQTDEKFFNENNSFDSEGLRILKDITESNRVKRNEIEQEAAVSIEQKNLEAKKKTLDLQREGAEAAAKQKAEIAAFEADQDRASKTAQIAADQAVETATLNKSRDVEAATIANDEAIQLAGQKRDIAVAEASKQKSAADAAAHIERAKSAEAEESVETARQVATANRKKEVALVQASEAAEEAAIGIKVAATAEREAAEEKAAAVRIAAQGEADADMKKAEALKATLTARADGERQLNEARNLLSQNVIDMTVREQLISILPQVMEQAMKPVEKIDSIRLVDMGNGLSGLTGGGIGAVAANGSGSMADNLVGALLKNRVYGPLLDQVMSEAGLNGVDPEGLKDFVSKTLTGEADNNGDTDAATLVTAVAAGEAGAAKALEAPAKTPAPAKVVTVDTEKDRGHRRHSRRRGTS